MRTLTSVTPPRMGARPVRYCLNLPIGGEAAHPRTLAGFAADAEQAGWDAVFVEDYIVYQNRQDLPAYDPWVALAAMAVATSRVRLGTMVTPGCGRASLSGTTARTSGSAR